MTRKLLWLVPGALVLALLASVLALPWFVASSAHRPAMEALASSLTGRQVKIDGKLSLALLPHPGITATGITISGPGSEIVTAKSLAMDVSLPALLRGRLLVQALSLDAPDIALPWPLPGGARAVAPPPWLAALHARITRGTITLGVVRIAQVNADIFTAPGGSASVSGTGTLADGGAITLSAALGAAQPDGRTPVSLQAATGGMNGDFSGTLDAQSHAVGFLSADLGAGIALKAHIAAEGDALASGDVSLTQGQEALSGSATLGFSPLALNADLTGQNIDFGKLPGGAEDFLARVPSSFALDISNAAFDGRVFPSLLARLSTAAAGTDVSALTLALPGGAALTGTGNLTRAGVLTGQATLDAPDTAALDAAYGLPALPGWQTAHVSTAIGGTLDRPSLASIQGTLGADKVSGNLTLAAGHVMGQLAFSHLDLAPLAAWVARHKGDGFTADGELTAARAEAGPVALQNLFIDGSVDGGVNIRRASANLYGGLAAGSLTLDSSFRVSAAHGFLDLPSAAALAALLPPAWKIPPALLAPSLNVQFAAQGPANALAASAVARLGDFVVTASPVVDLTKATATGPLTLQHPEAIAAMKLLGFGADAEFPGPGSLSLRARATLGAANYGLNDFVLSFGSLTASGQILVNNGAVAGQIDTGAVTIPALPMPLKLPASFPVQGKAGFSAAQFFYAGTQISGPATGFLALKPGSASLTVTKASIAGGTVSGTLTATPGATPSFAAQFLAQNIDPAALSLPYEFPFTLQGAPFTAAGSLTANGGTQKAWAASLGGNVTLSATQGTLGGIDLADFATDLGKARGMRAALSGGVTQFTNLSLSANAANGVFTMTQAHLAAPEGHIDATGTVGLDGRLGLALNLAPDVEPPVSAGVKIGGTWGAAVREYDLKQATGWRATVPLPLPPPPAPPPPGQ